MTPTPTSQTGLFAQLAPLLVHRAVLITVSKLEGDQFQVNICPRQLKDGENQALTTPLCVTGTAAELDAELVPQISSFVASHAGLNTNLAAIEREVAEAEKAAREEAKKKQRVVGNGGKKTADVKAVPPAAEPLSPEPPQTLSLFDEGPSAAASESTEASQPAVAPAE